VAFNFGCTFVSVGALSLAAIASARAGERNCFRMAREQVWGRGREGGREGMRERERERERE
jgi:hypothetical protein